MPSMPLVFFLYNKQTRDSGFYPIFWGGLGAVGDTNHVSVVWLALCDGIPTRTYVQAQTYVIHMSTTHEGRRRGKSRKIAFFYLDITDRGGGIDVWGIDT